MNLKIGFVAPSSSLSKYELSLGLGRLKKLGYTTQVHPNTYKKNMFFAGKDDERLDALIEYAYREDLDVLWCARGGYGASHLLQKLEDETKVKGIPPKKILAGYSDATVLLEFAKERWNWPVLHAPIPGLKNFLEIKGDAWNSLVSWIEGKKVSPLIGNKKLKLFSGDLRTAVEGELVGGNLSLWCTLMGTSLHPESKNKILFLEDVGESLSRIDRMLWHLKNAGAFNQLSAVVMGDFYECKDHAPIGIFKNKKGKEVKAPLRKTTTLNAVLKNFFGELSKINGLPVFIGAPVGHGKGKFCLPIGGNCRISEKGEFEVLSWNE